MIDLKHANEWQYKDENGLVFPWYVKPFLDVLDKWDLRKMTVFEYGAGASTLWYALRAKTVRSIDDNLQWYNSISNEPNQGNYTLIYEHDQARYIESCRGKWDIIVIDGVYRDECLLHVLKNVKWGWLILDNYEQSSVWMLNGQVKELLTKYKIEVFKQPNHYDWQTALITKNG